MTVIYVYIHRFIVLSGKEEFVKIPFMIFFSILVSIMFAAFCDIMNSN